MAHAIDMFFDEQASTAVRGLWQRLAAAGLPSLATRTQLPAVGLLRPVPACVTP